MTPPARMTRDIFTSGIVDRLGKRSRADCNGDSQHEHVKVRNSKQEVTNVPSEVYYSTYVLIVKQSGIIPHAGRQIPLKHAFQRRVSLCNRVFISVGKMPNAHTRVARPPADRPGGCGTGAPDRQFSG